MSESASPLAIREPAAASFAVMNRCGRQHFVDFFGIHAKIVSMKRYLIKYIKEDLDKKIILLTGPRQTGKTTISKLLESDFDYFNFDNIDDRLSLQKKSWDRSKPLVIFDELHKLKNWKSWLKGIYDTEGIPPS